MAKKSQILKHLEEMCSEEHTYFMELGEEADAGNGTLTVRWTPRTQTMTNEYRIGFLMWCQARGAHIRIKDQAGAILFQCGGKPDLEVMKEIKEWLHGKPKSEMSIETSEGPNLSETIREAARLAREQADREFQKPN